MKIKIIVNAVVLNILFYTASFCQQVTFEEVTIQSGMDMNFFSRWSTGQAWADYDNDGLVDVYVTAWGQASTGLGQNALYRNLGFGFFGNVAGSVGVQRFENSVGAAWADYDNDGDQDLFVANFSEGDLLFKNFLIESGSAVFLDVTSSTNFINTSVGRSKSAAWGDFNNDGFVDLYVCKFWGENALYQNNGGTSFTLLNGVFSDIRDSEWADWIDYDDDGDVDLYVVNREQENRLYRNDDGEFTLVFSGLSDTQYGRYSTWADYDNNNLLDLFVGNIGSNSLYKQDPAGTFTGSAAAAGVQTAPDAWDTWGATWGDYDGDGDLDLLYVGGFDEIAPTEGSNGTQGNILFENNLGTFIDRTTESSLLRGAINFSTSEEVGSFASSAAFADYDNDGDPDILITNTHQNLLFKNLNPVNNYLKVRVQGKGFGFNNRNGLGSKIRVFNANAPSVVIAMQEVRSGPEPQIAHFGLDEGGTYILEVTFLKNGLSPPETITVPNITVPLDTVIIQP